MASAPPYAEAFGQPLERFESRLGIPRTDVFFGEERLARTRDAVRRRYGLPDGRRVILYAPTFRGDTVTSARATDDLDLDLLRETLGEDHVLLVRLHPFIRSRTVIGPSLAGFAIDVSDHPDINELMLVSDVLVTDYSSAIFEYALLDPPDGLLRARLRGLRARARLLLRLSHRRARPDLRDHRRRWPRTFGPGSSTSTGWNASATSRSTSQMDIPQPTSRTGSSSRH